jgi:hypothetical protein
MSAVKWRERRAAAVGRAIAALPALRFDVNGLLSQPLLEAVKIAGYDLSEHAARVMIERDIVTTWVAQMLERPARTEADRDDPDLIHALGRIAERDDRVLRVIYNGTIHPPRIVTVYFDRGQRGKL